MLNLYHPFSRNVKSRCSIHISLLCWSSQSHLPLNARKQQKIILDLLGNMKISGLAEPFSHIVVFLVASQVY